GDAAIAQVGPQHRRATHIVADQVSLGERGQLALLVSREELLVEIRDPDGFATHAPLTTLVHVVKGCQLLPTGRHPRLVVRGRAAGLGIRAGRSIIGPASPRRIPTRRARPTRWPFDWYRPPAVAQHPADRCSVLAPHAGG